MSKKIKKVRVSVPGSAPDVDTDFHTQGREAVINYCIEKYGNKNVANIITYNAFKAKNSFKSICTLYGLPFAVSNRISQTIPNAIDNDDVALVDLFDEDSPRYNDGADFRQATSAPEWKQIVDMAIPLDGRIRGTGVHPCGVIISNRPISDSIPTQVRQSDGVLLTQWTYPQAESLGLIKMDFLGLDTLDIIQSTLEKIELNGKKAPDMVDLIRGEMDDPKTFELLQAGETVGIFQLGGAGVRELLKRAHPTEFQDIAAITALYRPGPMKMNAHNQYADRKNGREEVSYIHPEFAGTEVETILGQTYGLIVYQEQCMQLATNFAGMSSYEADQLRKAIGKKKMGMMMKLRPKFIEGITEQGFSESSADLLWETIAVFGQYGFNKSHSISYAINAYKTCFLKANYPSEFMAALLQQNTGEPKKIAEFIQEANSMDLRVGPVDINLSQKHISSSPNSKKFDIIYGFAGVKQVNEEVAQAIVTERDKNGDYKSVSDFLSRIVKHERINSAVVKRLAQAGAFDCFEISRRAVADKATNLTTVALKPKKQAVSLFDLAGDNDNDLIDTIDLNDDEYSYNDLIKFEADSLGFFISGHPTSRAGIVAKKWAPVTLRDLMSKEIKGESNVLGTFTIIESKPKKDGSRSIAVRIDDGRDVFDTYLNKQIAERIEKGTELKRREKVLSDGGEYTIGGNSKRSEELIRMYYDDKIKPIAPLEANEFYRFGFKQARRGDSVRLMVTDIEKVYTAYDGSIPYEIKLPEGVNLEALNAHLTKHKGNTYVVGHWTATNAVQLPHRVTLSRDFIRGLEQIIGAENIITEGI